MTNTNVVAQSSMTSTITRPPIALMSETFSSRCLEWDRLLGHQVALFRAAELAWFERMAAFPRYLRIVDFGCGNGDYLASINSAFPHNRYIGADLSVELIAIARQRHPSLRFLTGNFTSELQAFDPQIAILRFVLQHLPNPADFFCRLANDHIGLETLFVIEPSMAHSTVNPPLRNLTRLIQERERRNAEGSSGRPCLSTPGALQQILGSSWRISRSDLVPITYCRSSWPASEITGVLQGWLQALATENTATDIALAKDELDTWYTNDGHELSLCLNIWQLVRSS
ncbi:MAG: class I SAM-dependent methyltransferase [Hyphomicrobium sp.]